MNIQRVVWAARVGTHSAPTGKVHLVDLEGPENEGWSDPARFGNTVRRNMLTMCGLRVGKHLFTPSDRDEPCTRCSKRTIEREERQLAAEEKETARA